MKKLIPLIVLILLGKISFSQTGSITGTIKNDQNSSVGYVTVAIISNGNGTISDTTGFFKLNNIPTGNQQLKFSIIGFKEKLIDVKIESNKTVDLGLIKLVPSINQMESIKLSLQNPKTSYYVAKQPLEKLENPQVYDVISSDLLKEQVVTTFDDALKNGTGIEKLWESTGRAGDGAGYYTLRGFSVQPTLINGLPGLTNGSLDPANIESIEVIKGPSGALFGSSVISYGGLINTVTKKPYSGFGGEVSFTTGSFGLNRTTADLNTPLDNANKVLLRTNLAYHTEQSFQDAGFRKSIFIAPSLKYKANDNLTFDVSLELLESKGTNQTMLFLNRSQPLSYQNLGDLNYNNNNSYTSNNLSISNPRANLQAVASLKISENWSSQTVLSQGSSNTNGYYTYLYDFADGATFGRYLQKQNSTTYTTDLQENIVGDINIGKTRHRLLVGLDYFQRNVVSNHTGWVGFGSIINGIDNTDLTQSAADSALSGSSYNPTASQEKIYSTYLSDVVNINNKLSFLASLRIDGFNSFGDPNTDIDNYSQTALSPKFGAVYQLVEDKLSLFGNYMNGFSNVAPTTVSDINGNNPVTKTFEPEQANQIEFGIKSSLINNLLDATINYYDILVSNKVMMDPSNPNNSIQGGQIQSKGIEFSIIGKPINNVKIIAGYSYNDNKVLKADESSIFNVVGKRSSEAGPNTIFNSWITYTSSLKSISGLGIGFGFNGASERIILDSDVTGKFSVPSYTVFNSAIFYEKQDYRLTLKVDNISNKEYFKGWSTINPQRPRSYSINFIYRF